jgi:hypothetical protein
MIGTTFCDQQNLQYEEAKVSDSSTAQTSSVSSSPQQRVASASHNQKTIILRFTPRSVRPQSFETKAS